MIERKIQAAIVQSEQPLRVVVDMEGNLPEMDFEKDHGTIEDTLQVIGRGVLAHTVSVSVDRSFPNSGKTVYTTKPVGTDAKLLDPAKHRWGAMPTDVHQALIASYEN